MSNRRHRHLPSSRTSQPGHRISHHWAWEAGLLTVHVAAYLTVVLLVLSPVRALVFITVQLGLFGVYLGSSSAPGVGKSARGVSTSARPFSGARTGETGQKTGRTGGRTAR